jgi:hypothetical protein
VVGFKFSIGGDLNISYNDLLNSLNGLGNVIFVRNDLKFICNDSLTNFTGMGNIVSIGGDLYIEDNTSLISLTGLDSVVYIYGRLWLCNNNALTNLSGLDNVTYIWEGVWIKNNDTLTRLTSLNNVTSIWGPLWIESNDALTSLIGLENIYAESISDLYIADNSSLSTCEVQSVCDYLSSPNGDIEIHDNAIGCNSREEVEEACMVWIPNINLESEFSIYPNPAKKEIFISIKNGTTINEVKIYNQIGQKVLQKNQMTNTIDISKLRQGMYIIELVTNDSKIREKLIIR